jgi:hypothetical protein
MYDLNTKSTKLNSIRFWRWFPGSILPPKRSALISIHAMAISPYVSEFRRINTAYTIPMQGANGLNPLIRKIRNEWLRNFANDKLDS